MNDPFAQPHSHHTDSRRLGWALAITAAFMVVEVAGGLLAGSLALLADAGHMLTDSAALAIAWFAALLTRQAPQAQQAQGYHRAQVVAAFVNALALFGVVAWILVEAAQRLVTPRPVEGGTMLVIALLGLAANVAVLRVLRTGSDTNLNVSAARLHVIGDLLGSIGASIAAVVILATGWTPIDPLLSALVALLIVGSAWSLLVKSTRILVAPAPESRAEPEELRNTLYRKVTKGKRRLTRGRLLMYRVAVTLAWWLGHFLWKSCRMQRPIGVERARETVRESHSIIPAYWHQHLLFGVRALLDLRAEGLEPGFLISPSVDGAAPSMLVKKFGGHVIRGSSTHTGARALRDFYDTIVKQGISPAITPDGPRGPLHEFKPGAVLLSQMTGKPILPVSVAASHTWRFRTWDRFELPLPFSRVVIAYGEPVRIPRVLNTEALARMQVEMADRLQALNAEAHAALSASV